MTVLRLLMWLFLAYPVLSAAAAAPEKVSIQRFAMPISETVYKLSKWFEHSGVSSAQTAFSDGRVLISGSAEEGEHWRVELVPDSSLGTKMIITLDGTQQKDERIQQLADYLGKTQDEISMVDINPQAIPEAILNQIGNVACIHVQAGESVVQFSGFFIDDEGLILCTAHDLKVHEQVMVMTNTGLFYQGDIIKADFRRDLALIRVDAAKEEIVRPAEGRNLLGMGETVFSIGCPINLRGTIESGFINGPPRRVDDVPVWQVHMKVQPGSSGSPVFDVSGSFVGVVKGRHREAPDIGFLIPLEVVIDFLKDYFEQ